jgi:hypothetical protein
MMRMETAVASGKGVRADAHPTAGSAQGVEKRLAWRHSSMRQRVRWSSASRCGPCSMEEG